TRDRATTTSSASRLASDSSLIRSRASGETGAAHASGDKTMSTVDFSRYALSGCAAIAMLAGCGGSQPPTGAPGAMPQTSAMATHADRGKSWMLPEAKRKDLLYVADSENSNVR